MGDYSRSAPKSTLDHSIFLSGAEQPQQPAAQRRADAGGVGLVRKDVPLQLESGIVPTPQRFCNSHHVPDVLGRSLVNSHAQEYTGLQILVLVGIGLLDLEDDLIVPVQRRAAEDGALKPCIKATQTRSDSEKMQLLSRKTNKARFKTGLIGTRLIEPDLIDWKMRGS